MAKISSIFCALFLCSSASATLSGKVLAASNYLWRGISLSGDEQVVQGGIDYQVHPDILLGVFVSPSTSNDTETDLVAIYNLSRGEFSSNMSAIWYSFRKASTTNSAEIILDGSYKNFTVFTTYMPEYFGTDSSATYIGLEYNCDLNKLLKFTAKSGYTLFQNETNAGSKNYVHGKLSFTYTKDGYQMTAGWSMTDRKSASNVDFADDTAFMSFAKSF